MLGEQNLQNPNVVMVPTVHCHSVLFSRTIGDYSLSPWVEKSTEPSV